jgi:hypothetical protein
LYVGMCKEAKATMRGNKNNMSHKTKRIRRPEYE